MKESYYVTAGENSGIITGAYENALLCGQYMCGEALILEFGDFGSAEEFLLEYLTEAAPPGCLLPEHCRLNEMISAPKLLVDA